MRVIVAVKSQPGGSATSRVTRYISERDRDEQKEGREPRRLFSDKDDSLSYRQADRVLTGPWVPQKDELLHLAVSFRGEDFAALGENESSRQRRLKETAREAMQEMAEAAGAKKLIWVAGIHRNTAHPHLHLVIHRAYLSRATGELKQLRRLPREMLAGREKDAGGREQTKPGKIGQSFESALDRAIERARLEALARGETNQKTAPASVWRGQTDDHEDRLALGRAMVAEDRIEWLAGMRASAIRFGESRRYEVIDEHSSRRMLSIADLRRRAEAKANETLWRDSTRAKLSPEDRQLARQSLVENKLAQHGTTLERIEQARAAALIQINHRLLEAERGAAPSLAASGEVKAKYHEAEKELPVPIIARADLSRMQERAIAGGQVGKVRELEQIRHALAAENRVPARTPQEVGRLGARLLLAQSELTLAQERAARFEETKHWQRWMVSERETRKFSLAEMERAMGWESDQARFIGRARIHWDDGKRERAAQRVRELSAYRQSILDQIEAKRLGLETEVKEKAEMVATLFSIEAGERDRHQAQGRKMPPPNPSKYELALLDAHAQQQRDPGLHRLVAQFERGADVRVAETPRLSITERTARASARQIIAEIDVRAAHSWLESFNERRTHLDVIVGDGRARELTIKRLSDVEPKNELEKLFRPWLISGGGLREVTAAVDAHGSQVAAEYERAVQSRDALVELARQSERDFKSAHPGKDLPLPSFTPGELTALEIHMACERDPVLREHYARLYQDALGEGRGRDERLLDEAGKPGVTKERVDGTPDLMSRWREEMSLTSLAVDEGLSLPQDGRAYDPRDDVFSR